MGMLVPATPPSSPCATTAQDAAVTHPAGPSYLLSPELWQQSPKSLPVFVVYSQQQELF